MVKQLIVAATFLLIQDAPKTNYCTRAILDFTMLAQYLSHNDKTLSYIEHILYRFHKTKIEFENYCSIDSKLFWLTFNYPKFYAMTHFIKCIWEYGSGINYDMAHSKAAHKYFLKAFYGQTNEKEYMSQILKYNICHINVIAIQNDILMAKVWDRSVKKNSLLLTCPIQRWHRHAVQQMFCWSIIGIWIQWTIKSLWIWDCKGIKKYWRHAAQVVDELSHLKDFLPTLAIFIDEAYRDYDQKT